MSVPNNPLQIDVGTPTISDAEALCKLWQAQTDWLSFIGLSVSRADDVPLQPPPEDALENSEE